MKKCQMIFKECVWVLLRAALMHCIHTLPVLLVQHLSLGTVQHSKPAKREREREKERERGGGERERE